MKCAYRRLLTMLGLSGSLAFLVGSVLFLNPDRYAAGVYLFIYGSAAMLLERLGRPGPGGEGCVPDQRSSSK